MGFEPTTASLEGWNSTTELRPPFSSSVLSSSSGYIRSLSTRRLPALCLNVVGRQGFEPWKPMATDLQSAPFGHLGTCPKHLARYTTKKSESPHDCLPLHPNDEKRKASQSPHGSPSLLNKENHGELWTQA